MATSSKKGLARRVLDSVRALVRRKPVSDLSYEVQTPAEARRTKAASSAAGSGKAKKPVSRKKAGGKRRKR